jgi:hypothetical protein
MVGRGNRDRYLGALLVVPLLLVLVASAGAAAGHGSRGSRPRHSRGSHGPRGSHGSRHGGNPLNPGKPINLGIGYRPQVLVDEAGVAHITYSSPSEQVGPETAHKYKAGWDNYCRLARGARSCADHERFDAPIQYAPGGVKGLEVTNPFFGNSPGADQDIGEGSIPLATGDQLTILAHRPGNKVAVPEGKEGLSEDVNFLWTSDNGGRKFTGPGLTSTLDYYGGAVAYGNPSSIGIFGSTGELIGDENTGDHVFFQEVRAGTFAPASARVDLGVGKFDLLARRQIAADGDRPVVTFDDLRDVFVREYKGKGAIDDAKNWSTSKFPGFGPSITSGPHGTWLTYYPTVKHLTGGFPKALVVKLVDGHPSGPAVPVFPDFTQGAEDQLAEATDGELFAAWVQRGKQEEENRYVMMSTSRDGRHWSKPRSLYDAGPKTGASGLQIAVGPDGGGVAVFVHGGNGDKVTEAKLRDLFGIGGLVTVVPFGARGSTGKKGLGTGGSTDSGCLDVRFGAFHAHVDFGCFLQMATKKDPKGDASIAYGGVHINGLEVRPDAPGTAILIDAAAHTVESVGGKVSILLQHPGVPDVTLWDGPLHADLGKKDNVGDPLFSLPMSKYQANVLGFEPLGTPVVVLGKESATIPLALKLPAYLGVTGSATLVTNMTEGLVRPSLHIAIPDIALPGLALRGGAIDWAGPETQWTGGGTLEVPPGAGAAGLDVATGIGFEHGEYVSGGFTAAPDPGTPIYRNAYLANLTAALGLHPPASLTGNAELGAVSHGGGVYSLQATGPLVTAFGTPTTMNVSGSGAIYGVPLTSAHATFTTAGTFHESGILGFEGGGLTIGGTVDANTNLAAGTTSGTIAGEFKFLGQGVSQSLPFNDTGFGYCKDVGPASVGFVFKWSGGVSLHPTGCASALTESGTG